MCDGVPSCNNHNKYWVQGIGEPANLVVCGVHLSTAVSVISQFGVDVTVKTRRESQGKQVWGFPATHQRVKHN